MLHGIQLTQPGLDNHFHSDIVQADLNGTVISRLKSKCDRPSEPYRCYSGKTSFKVKSTDITQFVKKRLKVIRGHLYRNTESLVRGGGGGGGGGGERQWGQFGKGRGGNEVYE